jgi:hypothetical protein
VIGFLITCYKRNKLNCQVVMSYRCRNISKSMHIVNDIILILMLLMITMFTVDRFNRHKRRTIEICRKPLNEARQGHIPSEHEHSRARWEKGPGSAISGRVDQGQRGCHRGRTTTEDDQTEKAQKMANCQRMRGESRRNAQRPPSISSWRSTRKVGLTLGVMKTGPSVILNWTVRFP